MCVEIDALDGGGVDTGMGDQTVEMERKRRWDLLLRWGVIYGGAGV